MKKKMAIAREKVVFLCNKQSSLVKGFPFLTGEVKEEQFHALACPGDLWGLQFSKEIESEIVIQPIRTIGSTFHEGERMSGLTLVRGGAKYACPIIPFSDFLLNKIQPKELIKVLRQSKKCSWVILFLNFDEFEKYGFLNRDQFIQSLAVMHPLSVFPAFVQEDSKWCDFFCAQNGENIQWVPTLFRTEALLKIVIQEGGYRYLSASERERFAEFAVQHCLFNFCYLPTFLNENCWKILLSSRAISNAVMILDQLEDEYWDSTLGQLPLSILKLIYQSQAYKRACYLSTEWIVVQLKQWNLS